MCSVARFARMPHLSSLWKITNPHALSLSLSLSSLPLSLSLSLLLSLQRLWVRCSRPSHKETQVPRLSLRHAGQSRCQGAAREPPETDQNSAHYHAHWSSGRRWREVQQTNDTFSTEKSRWHNFSCALDSCIGYGIGSNNSFHLL